MAKQTHEPLRPATLMLALLIVLPSWAAVSIPRSMIGAGSASSSSASFAVLATAGQPTGQSAQGVQLRIHSGFQNPSGSSPTPVEESELPLVYRYRGSYPNPFNPRTMIHFDLPEPVEQLALHVYDIAGRHVATLVDGALPAGSHQIVWNGVDRNGNSVASGVYVCRLSSKELNATSKLTLVR